jgi:uncharacterized DUF497 family protein
MELGWGADKAAQNLNKHRVSFEDAELVFLRHRADGIFTKRPFFQACRMLSASA